jgi:hypothetical protein
MKELSVINLFPFCSGNIDNEELERIIKDVVAQEQCNDRIIKIEYNSSGVVVTLKSGQQIEIDIDWDEITLS